MKQTCGRALVIAYVAAIVSGGFSPASAQNLIKNPSFEQLRAKPTQFGHLFEEQGGWVYESPGKVAVGAIAHTGKYSYEIVNGKGGKTRYSSSELKLEPGRYRVTAFIRGLEIIGTYPSAMDVQVCDGNYHPIKVPQTFGWTKVTHVVQLDKAADKAIVQIGMIGGGYLWIDDVSLEKVDEKVALTKEPQLGKEEAPIAPPAKIAADAVRCSECGYRNNKEWTSCYACGTPIVAKATATGPAVKVLFDFEGSKAAGWSGGTIVRENAPQGEQAYQVQKGYAAYDGPQDWSGYDFIKIDVFNPQKEPVPCGVEIRDEQTRDYWTRVNYSTIVPPGKSTVTIPTDIYVGEKSRPGHRLIKNKVNRFVLVSEKGTLVFDNIRLERLDLAKVQFDGLQAFDFGLPDSPVMPGYMSVSAGVMHAEGRGYGFKSGWMRGFDGFQPDALFQDFIIGDDFAFQVDVPNGKYHVIMNIDSPGGFWGEVQQYTHRQVIANGMPAVDEKMTIDEFTRSYFRDAHKEDLPGLDTFEQYIGPMFHVKQFDIDVTDGKALFGFKSDGRWGIALSALVMYPADKADAGTKFWEWTTQQRRAQFNDYFKQIAPQAAGAKAPAGGYSLFRCGLMNLPNANDGPGPQDTIPAEGMSHFLAQGEEQAIIVALQPGQDLGEISVEVSEFSGPGGARLDPKTFQPGWLDYRITRVTAEGSVYTVSPRYWHPVPAPAGKVTRTFWVRTKIGKDARPGAYKGKLTIRPKSGPAKDVPVAITVLPFALDEATDVAAGPWGCGIYLPWADGDPKTHQWDWQMFEKVLDALRENGFTTVTGLPHIGMKAAAGKVTLDFTQADKEMKALRGHGFSQMISSYGAGLGYPAYGENGGADAFAKSAGFASGEEFLKALYGQIEQHAAANNWLPVAWNLCDEPLGDAAAASASNAALHDRVAKALNFKLQTFMGATSMEGSDPKNPHYALVTSLPMPSLNIHDEASIRLIHDGGRKFSFYNGGDRWTFGRYMKALVVRHGLAYRVTWHLNVVAGNPYYALDCREDDYCFYNSDQAQMLVPSVTLLGRILPGMNDYRYLTTLQRLIKEKSGSPAAAEAKKVFEEQVDLRPGKDRLGPKDDAAFDADRQAVTKAILSLIENR